MANPNEKICPNVDDKGVCNPAIRIARELNRSMGGSGTFPDNDAKVRRHLDSSNLDNRRACDQQGCNNVVGLGASAKEVPLLRKTIGDKQ